MSTAIDLEQGTDEWSLARAGRVTASRVADVLATTKSGHGASRSNYMSELIVERLTGAPAEHFVSKEMQWGTDHEEEARIAYEELTGEIVRQVGFVEHPTIEMSGASPDGLVGSEGIVEIKCPNTATHIATILTGKADSRYYAQMQWQMECTGRRWCDFVSYDPRMPENLRLFVVRVPYDAHWVSDACLEIGKFLAELDETVRKLRAVEVPARAR